MDDSSTISSYEALLDFRGNNPIISPGIAGLVVLFVLWTIYKQAIQTQVPKVSKVPTAPNALPFVGNLMPLGGRLKQNDCTIYSTWAKQLSTDIFQMRLGSERVLVANTFAVIKDLWVGHSADLIDKPQQHGFAEYLELDLSGANMTEPIRRCRKAATRVLGKPLWPKYYHHLEPYSVNLTKTLLEDGLNGKKHLDIYNNLRQIVFDLTLSLTYGTKSSGVDDSFTNDLVTCINQISTFRASTMRIRDYVPILRFLIPDFASGNAVASAEKVRQQHLDINYASLKERIASGEKVSCLVSGLAQDNLSESEIHGTCKALLQAAPDSTASSVYMAVAWLSTPTGQTFQTELYNAILAAYDGNRDAAWSMAFREEKVELLISMCKETLRFWTITPFALPRTTVKDISFRDTVIPKGITIMMNAQQANHDEAWFGDDAANFRPARYVGDKGSLPHLTFGAGSRVCPAAALSKRIIYALLARLVLAFKISEPADDDGQKANVDILDFSDEYRSLVAMPRKFDCCFEARNEGWTRTKL